MADEDARGVSNDVDLITKADIDELTKALTDFSKSVEELNKGLASHFAKLVDEQPQTIGGKGHSVTNTMQKAEDEDEPMPVQKSYDIAEEMDSLQKAYDTKIEALEAKIAKMETEVIRKGGSAVIIPEQLEKGDPILTNMSMLDKFGRTAQ